MEGIIIYPEKSGAEKTLTIADAERMHKEENWNFIIRSGKLVNVYIPKRKNG